MEKELFKELTLHVEMNRTSEMTLNIPIRGITPLVQKRFSRKVWEEIERAQAGKTTSKKPRNPEAEYEDAFYCLSKDGHGLDEDGRANGNTNYVINARAFKQVLVEACRQFDKISMVNARTLFTVRPDWVLIENYTEPWMYTAPVRLPNGTATLAHRPRFEEWAATVPVTFSPDRIPAETVLNVMDEGGKLGIGEDRPSAPKNKSGKYGVFQVNVDRIAEVNSG